MNCIDWTIVKKRYFCLKHSQTVRLSRGYLDIPGAYNLLTLPPSLTRAVSPVRLVIGLDNPKDKEAVQFAPWSLDQL